MIEILISYINLAERIKILLPSIHHKPLNFNRLRRDEGTKVRRYLINFGVKWREMSLIWEPVTT